MSFFITSTGSGNVTRGLRADALPAARFSFRSTWSKQQDMACILEHAGQVWRTIRRERS